MGGKYNQGLRKGGARVGAAAEPLNLVLDVYPNRVYNENIGNPA